MKSCPFCGNEEITFYEEKLRESRNYYNVGMECGCGCMVQMIADFSKMTLEEAKAKVEELWNKRM